MFSREPEMSNKSLDVSAKSGYWYFCNSTMVSLFDLICTLLNERACRSTSDSQIYIFVICLVFFLFIEGMNKFGAGSGEWKSSFMQQSTHTVGKEGRKGTHQIIQSKFDII